jgi:hypothetical protein
VASSAAAPSGRCRRGVGRRGREPSGSATSAAAGIVLGRADETVRAEPLSAPPVRTNSSSARCQSSSGDPSGQPRSSQRRYATLHSSSCFDVPMVPSPPEGSSPLPNVATGARRVPAFQRRLHALSRHEERRPCRHGSVSPPAALLSYRVGTSCSPEAFPAQRAGLESSPHGTSRRCEGRRRAAIDLNAHGRSYALPSVFPSMVAGLDVLPRRRGSSSGFSR